MVTTQTVLMIAFFGLIGVFSRFGIDQWTSQWSPWGTLSINILGSALAGVIFALGEKLALSASVQLGLLVGFCGGFTTFSTYALQSFLLFEKGRWGLSLIYISLSPLSGIAAAALGVIVTRKYLG